MASRNDELLVPNDALENGAHSTSTLSRFLSPTRFSSLLFIQRLQLNRPRILISSSGLFFLGIWWMNKWMNVHLRSLAYRIWNSFINFHPTLLSSNSQSHWDETRQSFDHVLVSWNCVPLPRFWFERRPAQNKHKSVSLNQYSTLVLILRGKCDDVEVVKIWTKKIGNVSIVAQIAQTFTRNKWKYMEERVIGDSRRENKYSMKLEPCHVYIANA